MVYIIVIFLLVTKGQTLVVVRTKDKMFTGSFSTTCRLELILVLKIQKEKTLLEHELSLIFFSTVRITYSEKLSID